MSGLASRLGTGTEMLGKSRGFAIEAKINGTVNFWPCPFFSNLHFCPPFVCHSLVRLRLMWTNRNLFFYSAVIAILRSAFAMNMRIRPRFLFALFFPSWLILQWSPLPISTQFLSGLHLMEETGWHAKRFMAWDEKSLFITQFCVYQ